MSERSAAQIRTVEREITADLIGSFAEISGDKNPLHMDEEYAQSSRFGARIAHGMLPASFISAALAELDGEIIYLSQDLSFNAPVNIGDVVTAEVVTRGVDDTGVTEVSTVVTNQDDKIVIEGKAEVLIQ